MLEIEQISMAIESKVVWRFHKNLLEQKDMFKRNVLSSAIVLAGSIWGSAALANTEAGAQFSSATDITKVSEWMGKNVQDNEGNEIGEISDFAINLDNGSVTYAVVGLSGMFNSDAIAVPISALSSSAENDDNLTLQASQSEWQSAETFSGSDWPLKASLATETGSTVTGTYTDESADQASTYGDENADQASMYDDEGTDQASTYGDENSDQASTYGDETSDQASDTEWQQSEDQYGESSGSVSSFDRDVEFDALDSDGDGYLSTEEFQAAKGTSTTDGTDEDQDGRISRSEFAAFEPDEQGSMTHKESSTDDRYGESEAGHNYGSQDSDDVDSDDYPE